MTVEGDNHAIKNQNECSFERSQMEREVEIKENYAPPWIHDEDAALSRNQYRCSGDPKTAAPLLCLVSKLGEKTQKRARKKRNKIPRSV